VNVPFQDWKKALAGEQKLVYLSNGGGELLIKLKYTEA